MVRDGVLLSSLSQRYAWLHTVELTVTFSAHIFLTEKFR